MSRILCDDCGARHGLANYNNGSYCFSCNKKTFIKERLTMHEDKLTKTLKIPEDSYGLIPNYFKKWLDEYFLLTNEDIPDCINLGYSKKFDRLMFLYNNGFSAWGRSLNKEPKWLHFGKKKLFSHYEDSSTVYIVEDIVSALRLINNNISVVCLGGTNFNSLELINIIKKYDRIVTWFDGDSAGKKAAVNFKKEFVNFKLINNLCVDNKDPKNIDPTTMNLILRVSEEKLVND